MDVEDALIGGLAFAEYLNVVGERNSQKIIPIQIASQWLTNFGKQLVFVNRRIGSQWLAIYEVAPFLVELAHVLDVGFSESCQTRYFLLELLTDGFDGSFAPHVVSRILGHIPPHAIVEREYFVVD